jgi:hypothetical protein
MLGFKKITPYRWIANLLAWLADANDGGFAAWRPMLKGNQLIPEKPSLSRNCLHRFNSRIS